MSSTSSQRAQWRRYRRSWIKAHPAEAEKMRIRARRRARLWHKNNPERAAALAAKWIKLPKNRVKAAESKKRWARANPEKLAASARKHRRKNIETLLRR